MTGAAAAAGLRVLAPLPGRVLALAQVPDPVFAQAIVGPGAALDPPRGPVTAVSPVAGRLVKAHPHAFVVLTDDGAGVLVHCGIDTVQLRGDGFALHAAEGEQLAAGQPVVSFDAAALEAGGRSPVCPVVVLDAPADAVTVLASGDVQPGDALLAWQR
ncbi:PTS glucose transporter subunit IIA [Quadrisphaera sp. DSM 44207]|uniref:PTS sugar transporter subunit IIA n=1 Tax=Quadrisphaera sp. DSM 44207 TaxID=1881057 RepID=UPI00088F1FF3|nr:PTS glucose transporter subunit IIA [Quadrisphaera sp. DSM 44207]SDQ15505.1 PTS system, N-acetylglucosamine-specific IIA component [Quadrisphaera sp. DSM 44207]